MFQSTSARQDCGWYCPKASGVPLQDGLRLDDIVSRLGGSVAGDGSLVRQVGSLASAGPGQIAFLANPKFRQQLLSNWRRQ